MQRLTPVPPRRVDQLHHPPNLRNCPFVFIRIDKVSTPLQPPYEGPLRVLDLQDKYFVIDINSFKEKVCIYRLKVAYLDDKTQASSSTQGPIIPPTRSSPLRRIQPQSSRKQGQIRRSRPPIRFADITH